MPDFTIPYNKPFACGNEFDFIKDAIQRRHLSGNGIFTNKCHQFLKERYGYKKCLLTTSCTDALEMCAILLNIQKDDEVIMPSFTFVSTANAFMLRGAKIILADSEPNNPNIDAASVEKLITPKTKAIVVVHYAGIACNMQQIMQIAASNNILVIEDAAQAVDSFFLEGDLKHPIGTIGHLSAFSFHESKNIQCGEGGMLAINEEKFTERSEIIWEKGTNRAAFFRREVDKYNWVDIGSSFLPSEINAAFLYAQLQSLDNIQEKRKLIWQRYFTNLQSLSASQKVQLPHIPKYATVNAHIFYLVCTSLHQRDALINFLSRKSIQAMFHYPGLHTGPFYKKQQLTGKINLINAEKFSNCLVRLPLYVDLTLADVDFVSQCVHDFFNS
jgi:dTDP-4-amino-4,6-dideoxygalactose transaminase